MWYNKIVSIDNIQTLVTVRKRLIMSTLITIVVFRT